VQEFNHLWDQHKIILDELPFDKGTLVGRDHFIKATSQSVGQDFRHQFGKT
jgi:hypothetical protein